MRSSILGDGSFEILKKISEKENKIFLFDENNAADTNRIQGAASQLFVNSLLNIVKIPRGYYAWKNEETK